MHEVRYPS
jgi:hypothetical protein